MTIPTKVRIDPINYQMNWKVRKCTRKQPLQLLDRVLQIHKTIRLMPLVSGSSRIHRSIKGAHFTKTASQSAVKLIHHTLPLVQINLYELCNSQKLALSLPRELTIASSFKTGHYLQPSA